MVCTMAPAATEATTKMHHVKADSGAGQPEPVHHPIQEPAAARPGAAAAQLVRQPPCWRPVDDFEATLGDYADCMLQACHAQSQRHLPAAASMAANVQKSDRELMLSWLVAVCGNLFDDTVLHSTILQTDRYSAVAGEAMTMQALQMAMMAALCIVLKTSAPADRVWGRLPVRRLLNHILSGRATCEEIFATEHRVLQKLGFMVTAPTPLDLLDGLCTPPTPTQDGAARPTASSAHSLASFLLQLSLFSVHVHYGYPHAILASSAAYVALASLRAPRERLQALMGDTSAACPDVSEVPQRVADCMSVLHSLWHDFAVSGGHTAPCLLRKFGDVGIPAAVLLHPPPISDVPHPAAIARAVVDKTAGAVPAQALGVVA